LKRHTNKYKLHRTEKQTEKREKLRISLSIGIIGSEGGLWEEDKEKED
jgi:16S rRNA U1498 N3-methylase RsmE